MKSLWNETDAQDYIEDPLALRVYSSRLLGREPALVLHGGGNTSVKATAKDIFGDPLDVLYVKGSGWDLASIETAGFPAVRLDVLQRMAELETLSDTEMVQAQRAAMLDPTAPNPSVEAILHAIIPFRYVDHTHTDAVVTITNTADGKERIQALYGDRVLVVPYVMPGFLLAKKIFAMTRDVDWSALEGMVLLNHGVFSFADDARESYERMITLVTEAEMYLARRAALVPPANKPRGSATRKVSDLLLQARARRAVSELKGEAMLAPLQQSADFVAFSNLPDARDIASRGPLTPDHVIRTKRIPAILDQDPEPTMRAYADAYQGYFDRHTDGRQSILDPAPRWCLWPGHGVLVFESNTRNAKIVADIAAHTLAAIQVAETLGGWQALPEGDIFAVEYWELEQAKLARQSSAPQFQGQIALVTGAASGIGSACVAELVEQGAAVIALDLDPHITELYPDSGVLAQVCDISDRPQVDESIHRGIQHFGGLDILVNNAGLFPASETIAEMQDTNWDQSLAVNLSGHRNVLTACVPFLKLGLDPAVVFVASKNVPAPGPGAAAYSVAKAGLTQLARVAALELAASKIRVNVVHPNAVFDTAIWTDEVLEQRAQYYGITVDEYKTNNLLHTEVRSRDVAVLVCTLAGPVFAKTTGAQISIDGGNERVI